MLLGVGAMIAARRRTPGAGQAGAAAIIGVRR